MKKIKIAFCDYCDGFEPYNNFILDTIKKYYKVEVIQDINRQKEVEFLFYSCFGMEHIYYDCVRIFYTGENVVPDFNICDYAFGFEFMTLDNRYFRFPYYMWCDKQTYDLMMQREQTTPLEQKKFCSFVVSQSSYADPNREKFFCLLSDYKKVDSGGRFLNNINLPQGVDNKIDFLSKYKFNIAFENSSYPGYCTEKLVEAFASGTIPIYWGDPLVEKYFNKKSFINCGAYSSFDEVVDVVKTLDMDDDLYNDMLKEKPIELVDMTREQYWNKFEGWLLSILNQEPKSAKRVSEYSRMRIIREQMIFAEKLENKYGDIERSNVKNLKQKIIRKLRLLKR